MGATNVILNLPVDPKKKPVYHILTMSYVKL